MFEQDSDKVSYAVIRKYEPVMGTQLEWCQLDFT